MLSSKHSCLPVVDDDGALIGVLTEAGFLRLATREVPPRPCGGVSLPQNTIEFKAASSYSRVRFSNVQVR
jgi:hypothetical protein